MPKGKSKTPQTIADLTPDAKNPNKGTERGSGLLENVLRKHGAARSIVVDRDNQVIAGNHVLQAAMDAGIERVRVVETTGHELVVVKRTDVSLDSQRGRELSIADNAIALRSIELDGEAIAQHAKEFGLSLDECGISDGELNQLLKDAEASITEEPPVTALDTKPPPAMAWVLVGIPTVRFGEIAQTVEGLAKIPGTIIESTVNDGTPDDLLATAKNQEAGDGDGNENG